MPSQSQAARKYLPGSALQASVSGSPGSDLLQPLPGLLTLAAYAGVALALAAMSISRRDA
jgi:hypothetical protein